MKKKSSRFDRLVAQYYSAVYSFASRLTDDHRDEIVFTRHAVSSAHKLAQKLRDPTAIAIVLLSSVIRAGLESA